MWEELWALENTARLSGALLLLITTGAVVCSALFERRLWCRYLCPIGGMNGMFAKLAVIELRADRGVCTAECSTYACIKGGPGEAPPSPGADRGLPTGGCPLFSHPASLTDNKDCTLCGVCVKGCAHSNVALRLRPPGADLWAAPHTGSPEEVALMLLLLGAVGVHRAPALLNLFAPLVNASSSASDFSSFSFIHSSFTTHALVSALLLLAPLALCRGADALALALAPPSPRTSPAAPYARLAYGWLPLVWAASLAHYASIFGAEAGLVLPRAAIFVGASPAWALAHVPHASLAPAAVAFVQASLLVAGGGAATALTLHLGKPQQRAHSNAAAITGSGGGDGGGGGGAYSPARVAAQCVGIAVAGLLLWPITVTGPWLVTGGA